MRKLLVADLYCGGGGTAEGAEQAARELGIEIDLLAINHWDTAIETHSKNHPKARHLCMNLDQVDPRKVIPGGRLDLLMASPECTHHSNAAGGKPKNEQSRASAWHVLRWAEVLQIDSILIENVPEFRNWGPLGADKNPLKSRKGETYQAFLGALRSLGYNIEERILCAADYGDPTTRRRLFIIAHRGRRKPEWPEITHTENGRSTLGRTKKWRSARSIIDWSIPSKSIFNRKKDLAPNTIRRIIAGLNKFGGKPFLGIYYGTNDARSLSRPTPTITAGGNKGGVKMALCEPFIIGQMSGNAPRSIKKPIMTITGTATGIGLCQPVLTAVNHGKKKGEKDSSRSRSIKDPMPTITTKRGWGLAYLVIYNGTGNVRRLEDPLPTITGSDRLGLVTATGDRYAIDIHFRMLQPIELQGATSFPKGYFFAGKKKDIVKQIGNAVPIKLARALTRTIFMAMRKK